MEFTLWELALLIIVTSFCVFAMINRICTCIEHCASTDAMAKCGFKVQPEAGKKNNE